MCVGAQFNESVSYLATGWLRFSSFRSVPILLIWLVGVHWVNQFYTHAHCCKAPLFPV